MAVWALRSRPRDTTVPASAGRSDFISDTMQRMDNTEVTTPLTSTSQFIEAGEQPVRWLGIPLNIRLPDDDDLDEESIPGFTQPGLVPSPHSPVPDKGKARAPEQLAPPSGSGSISGNIGTPVNGSASQSNRRTVGGVRVETRYVVHVRPFPDVT